MVAIWIRRTVDWTDEEAFVAQMPEDMPPKVELWNELFAIPYHLFRARVREIAALNHSRVEGAEVLEWDEIPDGTLVLPVDDDDWFAPDIVASLRPGGCYWQRHWIEVPTRFGHRFYLLTLRVAPWRPPAYVLTTNNYAMPKSDAVKPLLQNHVKASRWLKGGARKLEWIDRPLSIANRNLGSRTTLRSDKPTLSRSRLLRKYRSHLRLYDRPVPPELAWAEPCVRSMAELMRDLELR